MPTDFENTLTRVLDAHMKCTNSSFLHKGSMADQFEEQCDQALTEATIHLEYIVETAQEIEALQTRDALAAQRLREAVAARSRVGNSHTHILGRIQYSNDWRARSDYYWEHRYIQNRIAALSIPYQDAATHFEHMHPFYQKLETLTQIVGFALPKYRAFHEAYVATLSHLNQTEAYPTLKPCTPQTSTSKALVALKAAFGDNTEVTVVEAKPTPTCFQEKHTPWRFICNWMEKGLAVQSTNPAQEPTTRALR